MIRDGEEAKRLWEPDVNFGTTLGTHGANVLFKDTPIYPIGFLRFFQLLKLVEVVTYIFPESKHCVVIGLELFESDDKPQVLLSHYMLSS